ncbi:MAG TPA: sugar phosphate nucleotidyltransferase [Patescibacteria group bacterium]|nr:sugar phosphate nucleotidyltransferase [Patescibacteria group bacterium]
MSAMTDHLWGIILAGGEGRRLQPFIRSHLGSGRPKQYCALLGTRSMLRHTIARAERLIPPERLLTVVTRHHLPYAREELHDRPSSTVIVQPSNRDTGPGILLPLLHVYRRNPEAMVALLPSDHFICEEDRFMAAVDAAAACVAACPERPILLGVEPDRLEIEYGWIEAGEVIGRYQGRELHQVRRFWEKPDPQTANDLYLNGCLWNTMVLIGQAGALLKLFATLTPALFVALSQIRSSLDRAEEARALEEVYRSLPPINFSQEILTRGSHHLGVIRVQGIYWNDWGNPEQVRRDIARFGARRPSQPLPEWEGSLSAVS